MDNRLLQLKGVMVGLAVLLGSFYGLQAGTVGVYDTVREAYEPAPLVMAAKKSVKRRELEAVLKNLPVCLIGMILAYEDGTMCFPSKYLYETEGWYNQSCVCLTYAGSDVLAAVYTNHEIALFDVASGRRQGRISFCAEDGASAVRKRMVRPVSYTPAVITYGSESSTLITGSTTGEIHAMPSKDGAKPVLFGSVLAQPTALSAWGGRALIVGDSDGKIALFDLERKKKTGSFEVGDGSISSLVVLPKYIIAVFKDNSLAVVDPLSGRTIARRTYEKSHKSQGKAIACGDNQFMTTHHKQVLLYDVCGGLPKPVSCVHTQATDVTALLPFGAHVISASSSPTEGTVVEIWRPAPYKNGTKLLLPRTVGKRITHLAADQQGNSFAVATSGPQGAIVLWDKE